ncbi:MAG: GDP-mannose 4,6-dehydratase [Actinomycetota bacterium]|nr:GDP-mannose 4,6-dehydratase [Actinomycetota bacterium]
MPDDFWRDRPVLVTGGCGFIGSHLVEALLRAGAKVTVLDLYTSTGQLMHLEGVDHPSLEVVLGDVADPSCTRAAARGADVIFHLAALISIPYSYVAPAHVVATNVGGMLAVLEGARAEGVRRVVQTSTSEVYGSAQTWPMNENHPLCAQSPYAATKIAADQLALSYYRSFGLGVTVVRPFNTYGPRQSLRAIVPSIVAQALVSDEIVVGATTPQRDLTFVADTVRGFLAMGRADDVEGEVFNIGSGQAISVAQLIERVFRVLNVDKPIRHVALRMRPPDSEVTALICDASKARTRLGFEPVIGLDDGLNAVAEYLTSHPTVDPSRLRR